MIGLLAAIALEVVLPIQSRAQDPAAPPAGWCGETAIQEALLHYGIWASQASIHAAGRSKHPDLYSDEVPVALAAFGARLTRYRAEKRGFGPFSQFAAAAIDAGRPVLAGVKILPTEHPTWGLDHFVLVVGRRSADQALLVDTTWGSRIWADDKVEEGISFAGASYALRIDGVEVPAGARPARLSVVTEDPKGLVVRAECRGPGALRIERRSANGATAIWSTSIASVADVAATVVTIERAKPSRFVCFDE